jgi:phage gpG-like protein
MNIQIHNLQIVQSEINRLSKRIDSIDNVKTGISQIIKNRAIQSFNKEISPINNKKWIPSKRVLKKGGKTLDRTGYLKNNLVVSNKGLTVKASYGKYLQSGTNKMIARPFLPITKIGSLTPEVESKVKQYIINYIHNNPYTFFDKVKSFFRKLLDR